MKKVIEQLTLNERQTLGRLYESNDYKTLKKYMELLRFNAATNCLDAPDFLETKHLQGQAHALKMLHLNLKANSKESSKK